MNGDSGDLGKWHTALCNYAAILTLRNSTLTLLYSVGMSSIMCNQSTVSVANRSRVTRTRKNDVVSMPRHAFTLVRTMSKFSHTDDSGRATMVDVGRKDTTHRVASASARVVVGVDAFGQIVHNELQKGDVLTVSKLAGIMAAKECSRLIPLCHNIVLNKVDVQLSLDYSNHSVQISSTVETTGKTGVEMEALTAVSVAALTVYDMCKAVTHSIVIEDIKLLEKHGGRSGSYVSAP